MKKIKIYYQDFKNDFIKISLKNFIKLFSLLILTKDKDKIFFIINNEKYTIEQLNIIFQMQSEKFLNLKKFIKHLNKNNLKK